MDCLEGIVDLALARAERDDAKMLALVAYKSRSGESDPIAQQAYTRRLDFLSLVSLRVYSSVNFFFLD